MDEQPSVALVAALANLWAAIRAHHPDVPEVMLIPAPSPHGRRQVLGHFSALRWNAPGRFGAGFHEVVVVAEHLDRSVEAILGTLLHEAAHAMNFERGLRDCSRSQYHNHYFKLAAEEVGLTVTKVLHYGYAQTTARVETRVRYSAEAESLAQVLAYRRCPIVARQAAGSDSRAEPPEGAPSSAGRYLKASCRCPYNIRVSRRVMAATAISCGTCGDRFRFAA